MASFPHIFRTILSYCDTYTLTTILRCSNSAFDAASPLLYRQLSLDADQFLAFAQLAARGWDLSTGMRRSLPLQSACHPSLGRALAHVQFLSITTALEIEVDHWPLPAGLLANIRSLRLKFARAGYVNEDWPSIILPGVRHFIQRGRSFWINSVLEAEVQAKHPSNVEHVTVLADSISLSEDEVHPIGAFGSTGQTCTLVFLPHQRDHGPYDPFYSASTHHPTPLEAIQYAIARFCSCAPPQLRLEIVGLEYAQGHADGLVSDARLRENHRKSLLLLEYTGASPTPRYRRFDDWLAEQEPGLMFDEQDERLFRDTYAEQKRRLGERECSNYAEIG